MSAPRRPAKTLHSEAIRLASARHTRSAIQACVDGPRRPVPPCRCGHRARDEEMTRATPPEQPLRGAPLNGSGTRSSPTRLLPIRSRNGSKETLSAPTAATSLHRLGPTLPGAGKRGSVHSGFHGRGHQVKRQFPPSRGVVTSRAACRSCPGSATSPLYGRSDP
jgi:hypothetical protein